MTRKIFKAGFNSIFTSKTLTDRFSLSLVAFLLVISLSACGGYGAQSSTLSPKSLAITPANPVQAVGDAQQFRATATFSDNTTQDVTAQATWTSDTISTASISRAGGLENAVAAGDSNISASFSYASTTVTATTAVHVTAAAITSIAITPTIEQLELGANQQFTATATLDDGTTRDVTQTATWRSSDTSVLRVNTTAGRIGVANTRGAGTVSIRATVNGTSGLTTMTVVRRVPKFLYAAGLFGINGYTINPASGKLTPAGDPFTAVGAITSLTVTRDRHFLYAADAGLGVVWAFQIDAAGALVPVHGSPFSTPAITDPSSVIAHPNADLLFVTDIDTGSIITFAIAADGSLTTRSSTAFLGPQLLFAAATPDGKFFYQGAHLAEAATITSFSVAANGSLSASPGAPATTAFIPRTLTVDPSGRFLYATIPTSSLGASTAVFGYAIDAATGNLTPLTGSPFTAGDSPVSSAADPSGRFLYVTNNANSENGNSVSGFSIDDVTGALTRVPNGPFPAANSPVSVAVEPGGQFAYVGLVGSQGMRTFTIDQQTGALTEIPDSAVPAEGDVLAIATTY